MRRRFGRRRRSEEGRPQPIDAARLMERMQEHGVGGARTLAPSVVEGIPDHFAVVARGENESGQPLVVAVAPRHGGDALLAALVAASGTEGEVLALAPRWTRSARRRLGLAGTLPFTLRALAAPWLDGADEAVEPELPEEVPGVSAEALAAHFGRESERALFERAARSLAGLAAKHDGAVRVAGRSLELVILARRVAALRADEAGVVLDSIQPQRSSERLDAASLAGALDRLEGNLRKRIGDRRVLDSEDGQRGALVPVLAEVLGLRAVQRWPLGGTDADVIDLVGVAADGRAVVAASRERLGLAGLGPILDAWLTLAPALPSLLADAGPPRKLDAPRLVLAVRESEPAVWTALEALAIEWSRVDVGGSARAPEVAGVTAREVVAPLAQAAPARSPESEPRPEPRRPRGRERGRGRRRGAPEGSGPEERTEAAPAPRYEELSFFDLEEGSGSGSETGGRDGRRRRRGRRRGRGRRGPGEEGAEVGGSAVPSGDVPETRSRGRWEERQQEPRAEADADEELDLDEGLSPLDSDVPELEAVAVAAYEEESPGEEVDPEVEAMHLERERRRLARLAKAGPPIEHEEPPPPRPRRAALVAHADRDSLAAAVVLARDLRSVEGIWVYPQSELMTFFRSVATDLREDVGIFVVGFAASPARDTIQAATLYRDRIYWYDHHAWPPEDLEAMRQAIGEHAVEVATGAHSSLPLVLPSCTRRSRFSDKLVDLVTARFTQHDFERWGRRWWWRFGELAGQSGDRRSDLGPILAGRPSELAREAARAAPPPPPAEAEYATHRDFRMVHFGGYSMVLLSVPSELDVYLTGRIVRERYGATLSLAWSEGSETVILGGDDASGRHSLDLASMTEHLADKHEWIDRLPEADHVARVRVHDLALHPERIDAVAGEIARGRSIFEG